MLSDVDPFAERFYLKGHTLRVVQFRNRRDWTGYQLLEVRRLGLWWTIARAEIPSWHFINLGALGYSTWISPFDRYGPRDRDGVIKPQNCGGRNDTDL